MPEEQGLPYYPNYRATFGTGLAVVTSLLASISTAIVVVLSANTTLETGLGFLAWTPDQIGTATGSAATVLFVAATLAAVYAQAANHEEVPRRIIIGLLKDREDKDTQIQAWRRRCEKAYKSASVFWISGIALLLVTLGILAYNKLPGELPIVSIAAVAVVSMNFLDPSFRSKIPILLSVAVVAASGVVAAAAAQSAWF